jgi:hypothetical protein
MFVMAGTRVRLRRPEHRPVVPAIHVFSLQVALKQDVDARES